MISLCSFCIAIWNCASLFPTLKYIYLINSTSVDRQQGKYNHLYYTCLLCINLLQIIRNVLFKRDTFSLKYACPLTKNITLTAMKSIFDFALRIEWNRLEGILEQHLGYLLPTEKQLVILQFNSEKEFTSLLAATNISGFLVLAPTPTRVKVHWCDLVIWMCST